METKTADYYEVKAIAKDGTSFARCDSMSAAHDLGAAYELLGGTYTVRVVFTDGTRREVA